MNGLVTVALPTLDAGEQFAATLAAIAGQQVAPEVEILVCDSSSSDGTRSLARAHGARVIEIPRAEFSHGATRNLLMREARGSHVAFLTQDAVPADDAWLARLLDGFTLAPDVGLVFGPYLPRRDASLSVRRELSVWFGSLAPDGAPRVDRLAAAERARPAAEFWGPLGYFTDANGAVAKAAWERVPFRAVAYAEDHRLAQDMLRAGYAKVFAPQAAVVHSHEYSPLGWLRRAFDETRAVAEVYDGPPAGGAREALLTLRGNVGADVRLARTEDAGVATEFGHSLVHHGARTVGALLGARARALPSVLTARLSLERRG